MVSLTGVEGLVYTKNRLFAVNMPEWREATYGLKFVWYLDIHTLGNKSASALHVERIPPKPSTA